MSLQESDVQLDRDQLTVSDIRQLENPVLRDVLLRVKQRIEAEATSCRDEVQHYSHGNFYSSITAS